ncbi:putative SOS response-associated peptidase YedK [Bradyrhizobium sp. USDA 4341]
MCNLYRITTNQAAILNLFRAVDGYVGNLAPMPGAFPDYSAPVVRNAGDERRIERVRLGAIVSARQLVKPPLRC